MATRRFACVKAIPLILAMAGQSASALAAKPPPHAPNAQALINVVNAIADSYVEPIEPTALASELAGGLTAADPKAREAVAACEAASPPVPEIQNAWAQPIDIAVHCVETIRGPGETEAAINRTIEVTLADFEPRAHLYIRQADNGPYRKTIYRYAAVAKSIGRIGITLKRPADDYVEVVGVLPDWPADRASIAAGDRIIAIGDEPLTGLSLNAIMVALSGEVGSSVSLRVRSKKDGSVTTRDVRRRMMPSLAELAAAESTSASEASIDPVVTRRSNIPVIAIPRFVDELTAQRIRSSLRTLLADRAVAPVAAILLDLRGNSGGTLTAIAQVADLFLDRATIMTTSGRTAGTETFTARRGDEANGTPLYVLIDQNMLPGGEAFAAALRDNNRARILGEATHGEGTIKMLANIDEKRAIHIPQGRLIRPNGQPLSGITPDIALSMTRDAATDDVLDAAVEAIGQGGGIGSAF
jgi:C-terminal peptidase prc